MFNDKYGLTQAVLNGRKTMTRRMVDNRMTKDDIKAYLKGYTELAYKAAHYKNGEIVAVAQSYETLANCGYLDNMLETSSTFKQEYCGAGWNNKMFVRADLMPHRIRITDVMVERLQDISHEDCMKEGIFNGKAISMYTFPGAKLQYGNPILAYSALIDKVNGKGTWESNPFVFVYNFELIK